MKKPSYFSSDFKDNEINLETIKRIGKKQVLEALYLMVLIRHFEIRGESAYQQGLIGGFYHAYSGQEAIQTAAVQVFGKENWYVTSYRCHALPLLLGVTPHELMAELYGRLTGNAKGRGGSMHFYTNRMLGGAAIVGGHLPIAIGAAFSIKYQNKNNELSVCFLGEGAVAQGAFHESLNLASLWDLPVIFIIENNQWGMGTHASRALCCSEAIAEKQGPSYNINSYKLNGMNYFDCYQGFRSIYQECLKTGRPVLIECLCERLKGHSISDPGLYRTKTDLEAIKKKDPIVFLKNHLKKCDLLTEEEFEILNKKAKDTILESMTYAENSPWPSPAGLEQDVYAP
ncbi:MAG: thiamine pyrophosphate-dependent enzyme [Chlamydiales bacterium]